MQAMPKARSNFSRKLPTWIAIPKVLRALFQAYFQAGRLPEAGTLAAKLLSVHNDAAPIHAMPMRWLPPGNSRKRSRFTTTILTVCCRPTKPECWRACIRIIGHVRENPAALETLLALFQKAGENTHLTEIYELLAHAYVQSGELEKSRDYYLKLTQLEPQKHLHAQNYQQVLGKLGDVSASRLITAEEGAVLVDELEATAPFHRPAL